MTVLAEPQTRSVPLATVWSSDYRAVDKVAVFGGSLQVMLQHFGETKAVLVPLGEYERLTRLCPKVQAPITQQVSAGDIQKRPGDSMLGVKGGGQVLGIVRYGQLKAAMLPYGVFVALKTAAGEQLPQPAKQPNDRVPAVTKPGKAGARR